MALSIGATISHAVDTNASYLGTSHACGANTKKLVVVVKGYDSSDSDSVVNSVTYDGIALAEDVYYRNTAGGDDAFIGIYSLSNPTTNTVLAVEVNMAGTCTDVCCDALDLIDASADTVWLDDIDSGTTTATTSHSSTINPAVTGSIAIGAIVNADSLTSNTNVSTGTLLTGSEVDFGSQCAETAYVAESGGSTTITWGKDDTTSSWACSATYYSVTTTTTLEDPTLGETVTDATPDLTLHGNTSNKTTTNNIEYEIQIDSATDFGVIDFYSETNISGAGTTVSTDTYTKIGQSFTGDGRTINKAILYLRKVGSPTGTFVAKIYDETHATAFGTDSVPTGTALATSDSVNISTLGNFFRESSTKFSTPYTTTNGNKYVVVYEFTMTGTEAGGNYIQTGVDFTSPSHSGNRVLGNGGWTPSSSYDVIFYVMGPIVDSFSTDALGDFEAGHPYDDSEQVTYTVQDVLSPDTYYWRAKPKDVTTGVWGAWGTGDGSGYSSFVLDTGVSIQNNSTKANIKRSNETQDNSVIANIPVPTIIHYVQAKDNSGTSTDPAATLDTAPTEGNTLIAMVAVQGVRTLTVNSGGGWTKLTEVSSGDTGGLYWKTVGASESATQQPTTSDSGSAVWAISIAEYSDVATTSPVDVETGNSDSDATKTVTNACDPTDSVERLIIGGALDTNNGTWSAQKVNGSTAGVTERGDVGIGSATNQTSSTLFDKIETSTQSGNYTTEAVASGVAANGAAFIAIFKPSGTKTNDNSVKAFIVPKTWALDQNQTTDTGGYEIFGEGNTEQIAQTFEPSVSAPIADFNVRLGKIGSPTDNVQFQIYSDSGSAPDTLLGTSDIQIAGTDLTTDRLDKHFIFNSGPILSAGTTYWAVLSRTGGQDGSNYYSLTDKSFNPYSNGALYGYHLGSWNTIGFSDAFFNEYRSTLNTLQKNSVKANISKEISFRKNIIVNPNFETNDYYWSAGGGGSKAQSSTEHYLGSNSLLLTATDTDQYAYFTFNDGETSVAGKKYILSAYVKGSGYVKLWMYDGAQDIYGDEITLDGTWTRYSFYFEAKTTSGVIGGLRTSNGAANVYIDAVLLEEGGELGSYFDGSTANAFWTGDAHNSTSLLPINFQNVKASIYAPTTQDNSVRTQITIPVQRNADQIHTIHVGGQSIDSHAETYDTISAIVGAIITAVPNTTYIAIGTFLDYASQISLWAQAIHSHGRKVAFRSAGFNTWKGTNGESPTGTPSQHRTDVVSFINSNYTIFESGDIFECIPDEAEGGQYWFDTYGVEGVGTNQTSIDEFNAFITGARSDCDTALSNNGVSGVDTGYIWCNIDVIKNVVSSGTASGLTALGSDNYPEGSNTDPTTQAATMQTELDTYILPAHPTIAKSITFGPNINVQLTESQQSETIGLEYDLLVNNLKNLFESVTLWQFGDEGNSFYSRLFDYTGGVWVARSATAMLNTLFGQTYQYQATKANITTATAEQTKNNSSKADILVIQEKDNSIKASLQTTGQSANSVLVNILRTNETQNNSSKANISVTETKDNISLVNILVFDNTNSNSVKVSIVRTESYDSSALANILTGYSKNNSAVANIVAANQSAIYSKANILTVDVTQDNNSKANLVITEENNQSSKTNILQTLTKNNSVTASIVSAGQVANTSIANILRTDETQVNSVIARIDNRKRYWIGGGGNWSDTSHWSYESGGSGGAPAPSQYDDVYIDSSSGFGAGGTITLDGSYWSAICHDFTSTTGASYTIAYSTSDLTIFGSAVFESGITWGSNCWLYFGSNDPGETIQLNGCDIYYLSFGDQQGVGNGDTGEWEILDNLTVNNTLYHETGTVVADGTVTAENNFESYSGSFTSTGLLTVIYILKVDGGTCSFNGGADCSSNLQIYSGSIVLGDYLLIASDSQFYMQGGSFDANDNNVTAGDYYFYSLSGPVTLSMGSGTWEKSASVGGWIVDEYGGNTITINAESSTLNIYATSGADFGGVGKTYNNVNLYGYVQTYSSNTFANLSLNYYSTQKRFSFEGGQTQTIIGTFTTNADASHTITLDRVGTGQHYLSKSSGIVECEYLDITNSNAGGGAIWYAINSINSGGNSGWIFAYTKNSSALANIQSPTTIYEKNNSVKASIVVSETNDNNSVANILTTYAKENSVVANISVVGQVANYVTADILRTGQVQINSSKANVVVLTQQSNSTKADILREDETHEAFAKADILVVMSEDSFAKASVVVSNSNNNSSLTNILVEQTKDNSAIASILTFGQQPNYVIADILRVDEAQNNWAKANTVVLYTNDNDAKANIVTTIENDVSFKANIRITSLNNNPSKANIVTTETNDNYALADILKITSKDSFAKASIQTAGQSPSTAKADILRIDENKDNSSKSNVVRTEEYDNTTKTWIYRTETQENNTKVNILVIEQKNNSSKANVTTFGQQANYSRVDILRLNETRNNQTKTSIVRTEGYDSRSKASINRTETHDNEAKSDILATLEKSNYSKARIQTAGQQVNNAKVDILRVDESYENSAKAQIYFTRTYETSVKASLVVETTKDVTVLANILRIDEARDNYSKTNVLRIGVAQGNSTKASIVTTNENDNEVKANIVVEQTKNILVKASIQQSGQVANYTKTDILRIDEIQNNNSKSNIYTTNTSDNSATANILVSVEYTRNQSAKASFGDKIYTRESKVSLPSNDANLATAYTSSEIQDVSLDNSTYVDITGGGILIDQFKDQNTNNTEAISVHWNGKSSVAPSAITVYLQIYNRISTTWEDVASNSVELADTDFDLQGTISDNLDQYYDNNNWISCRVYQGI